MTLIFQKLRLEQQVQKLIFYHGHSSSKCWNNKLIHSYYSQFLSNNKSLSIVVPIKKFTEVPCPYRYNGELLNLYNTSNFQLQFPIRHSSHTTLKDLEPIGKKKKTVPDMVLLIDEKDSISVVTLEDAEKIAKKRKFGLVEVKDIENKLKTEKKVFKLVSKLSNVIGDDKKLEKKEDKVFLLKAKITTHDLISKVKQINRMLEKGHSVRVVIGQSGAITTGSPNDAEKVYSTMIEHLVGAKIKQKQIKGNEVRFVISTDPSKVIEEKKKPEVPKHEPEVEAETQTVKS